MRTKTISFTFAYQCAEYDELVKEIIEKMYNAGLEMAKGKNMAICCEGEQPEKKKYDNGYDTVRHIIGEWEQPSKNDDFLKNVWTVSTATLSPSEKSVDLNCKEF